MFDKVRKNFVYCCMRLPMQGKEVDYAEFNKMIDAFLDNGFNYFVPVHGYLDGSHDLPVPRRRTPFQRGKGHRAHDGLYQ